MDQFSVTEARTAIACPRIFYFDERRFRDGNVRNKRVTRIWTSTIGEVVPSGSLFHQTVERFNATALRAEGLRQAMVDVSRQPLADPVQHVWEAAMRFLNANVLPINVTKQTAVQQAAFVRAVHQYVRELAFASNRSNDEVLGLALAATPLFSSFFMTGPHHGYRLATNHACSCLLGCSGLLGFSFE